MPGSWNSRFDAVVLAILTVFREPVVLAIPRDDRLASVKNIAPEELKGRPLVLVSRDADLAYDKTLSGLQAWGYRPDKIFDVLTVQQVVDFVAAGEAHDRRCDRRDAWGGLSS